MKNFLDLLATNFSIDIEILLEIESTDPVKVYVNTRQIYNSTIRRPTRLKTSILLLAPIDIVIQHNGIHIQSLKIDGWETRPRFGRDSHNFFCFTTSGLPFYQWKHNATEQGWLLEPN